MRVYSYHSGADTDIYGFTADASGSNLPGAFAPWRAHGTHDINPGDGPRIGVGSDDVLAGIQKDGYYLARVKITVSIVP